ncbi:hypothetical protein V499_03048 [Pseudogymnoascus sp. VKM F-103]|nr:hypothetical protein V499_03048 [Pseudogymnoascus sp. VKM F-103]
MEHIDGSFGLASLLTEVANTTFANATFTNAAALSTTACPDDSKVPWQSALWAILALALNAMTQPSSADPSPTPAISFVRSSPVICFIDAVSIPIWLAVGCYYGESTTNSLTSKRLATRPNRTPASAPIFSATTSAVFFILGPLPQAIKLAGMSGVSFTKFIGFIFLVAYLLGVYEADAAHRASRRHTEKPWLSFAVKAQRIPETVRIRLACLDEVLRYYIFFVHFSLWVVVAHMVVYPSTNAGKVAADRLEESVILLTYQLPIVFIAVPAGLWGKRHLGKWLHERFSGSVGPQRMRKVVHAGLLYGPAVLSGFSAFALSIFLFQLLKNYARSKQEVRLGWKAYADTKDSFVKLSGFILVLFVLAVCIPLLSFGLYFAKMFLDLLMEPEPEINKPKLEKEADDEEDAVTTVYNIAVLGFALSNLFFAILFYAHGYVAEGTSKPGWSEMLG